jgi:hypothetical protein
MVRFNDKVKQDRPGLPTLKMRIGIHTGPVVVGTLGNDLRVEFKAVGDTVNLSSRMEGLAKPGTTYVSVETFKLTEGLFRFEGLGEKEVKGKEAPVPVYRVIAPSTRGTRFDVSAERGLTPFVGRERELELLLDAFERYDDVGDIRELEHVTNAIVAKFQASKDLTVIPRTTGTLSEPSEPRAGQWGWTDFFIMDCTEPPPPWDEGFLRGVSLPDQRSTERARSILDRVLSAPSSLAAAG